eukprot:2506279-Prymnesium_polylepis.1
MCNVRDAHAAARMAALLKTRCVSCDAPALGLGGGEGLRGSPGLRVDDRAQCTKCCLTAGVTAVPERQGGRLVMQRSLVRFLRGGSRRIFSLVRGNCSACPDMRHRVPILRTGSINEFRIWHIPSETL